MYIWTPEIVRLLREGNFGINNFKTICVFIDYSIVNIGLAEVFSEQRFYLIDGIQAVIELFVYRVSLLRKAHFGVNIF